MTTHNPYFNTEGLSNIPNGATFVLFEPDDPTLEGVRIEKKYQGESGILCEVQEGSKKHAVLKLDHSTVVKEVERE